MTQKELQTLLQEIGKLKVRSYDTSQRFVNGIDTWGDEYADRNEYLTNIYNLAIDRVIKLVKGKEMKEKETRPTGEKEEASKVKFYQLCAEIGVVFMGKTKDGFGDLWKYIESEVSQARKEERNKIFTKEEWDLVLYAVSGNAREDTGDFDRLGDLFCDQYGEQLNEITKKYDKLLLKVRRIIEKLV